MCERSAVEMTRRQEDDISILTEKEMLRLVVVQGSTQDRDEKGVILLL